MNSLKIKIYLKSLFKIKNEIIENFISEILLK